MSNDNIVHTSARDMTKPGCNGNSISWEGGGRREGGGVALPLASGTKRSSSSRFWTEKEKRQLEVENRREKGRQH